MVLTRSQAQEFYDRFGEKQDAQAFYEDAAVDDMVAHAAFAEAASVFEFGFGTGRFAAQLLAEHLSPSARYFGVELSQTMTTLAQQRLAAWGERAKAIQADDSMRLPLADHCVDRVVSAYVLDLLSEADARQFLAEATRILKPGGKLCLVSLTHGTTFISRMVSAVWQLVFRLRASLVGGCRPTQLEPLLDQQAWSIEHHTVVVKFGVPSEVLIAAPLNTPPLSA